jgi:AmiR/NasT family two-component response regulator
MSSEHDSVLAAPSAPLLEGVLTDGLPLESTAPDVLLAELVAARREISELKTAVVSNRNIGAATGILMARHSLTQPQAFDVLRQESQRSHRKLRDVAEEVLFTGRLPGKPAPDPAEPASS